MAGPEAANNAAAGGAFIPLLTLGIPPNVVMALLLGAFIVHGLQPGPLMMTQKPDLFWGIVASMYIGNVMLLVLNMPLIGMWVQVLKVPYNLLFPLILMFCIVGVFARATPSSMCFVMTVFGVFGYLMRKFGYEPAPLVLAFVLGPMLENNLRKSLILSHGDFWTFLERPISAGVPRHRSADPADAAASLPLPQARRHRFGSGHEVYPAPTESAVSFLADTRALPHAHPSRTAPARPHPYTAAPQAPCRTHPAHREYKSVAPAPKCARARRA